MIKGLRTLIPFSQVVGRGGSDFVSFVYGIRLVT